ncbi:MAG: M28 family peptidase [Spirochaetes bacterium]|nr:M28 family peptidase [Spirochaetota bacterium]
MGNRAIPNLEENRLLRALQLERIESHLSQIASYDRLAGSRGEEEAVQYIQEVFEQKGIWYRIKRYPVLLSNPIRAELRVFCNGKKQQIPAKTRSFSGETKEGPKRGILRWIDPGSLVSDTILFQLIERRLERDLEGCIPCTPILNPIQVLQLEKRGAVASLQIWQGKEELIHEGINNPIWGTPNPEQLRYYTNLPILVICQKHGEELKSLWNMGSRLEGEIYTRVETGWYSIPQLEAEVGPKGEKLPFVLIGSHLDSWYQGATDNGTGNAIVLSILETLQEWAQDLRFPVKAVFWSGHSNGRYAGSAAYARDNFQDLWNRCIGYINLDMPGLRGASDYSRLASGPELVDAAKDIVYEITGQKGSYVRPVRGWDQSFQNIGVSPFFVWASTLPPGHPDSTANTFMSYWWHTEEDLLPYHDPEVLLQDGKIYLLAAYRLASYPETLFKPDRLIEEIDSRLKSFDWGEFPSVLQSSLLKEWQDFRAGYKKYCSHWIGSEQRKHRPQQQDSSHQFLRLLRSVKLLNRLYYTEKDSYTQDFALEQEALPGLSRISSLHDPRLSDEERELLRHYLIQQLNRFIDTLDRTATELAGI